MDGFMAFKFKGKGGGGKT